MENTIRRRKNKNLKIRRRLISVKMNQMKRGKRVMRGSNQMKRGKRVMRGSNQMKRGKRVMRGSISKIHK